MAETIKFSKVLLKSFSRDHKKGVAKFQAQLTDALIKAMGWTECPDIFTSGKPEGELLAKEMELKPSEAALEMHAIGLSVNRVAKFEIIRREIEGKRGKGHRFEVHFEVAFGDTKGCQKLEKYLQTIGEGEGKMTVQYEKQTELQLETPAQGELIPQ